MLVASLLHADAQVRTAGASLAFNVAAYVQRGRVERVRGDASAGSAGAEEDGEWEVELVSAVLEAVAKETQSEEVGESPRSPCVAYWDADFGLCSPSVDGGAGVLATAVARIREPDRAVLGGPPGARDAEGQAAEGRLWGERRAEAGGAQAGAGGCGEALSVICACRLEAGRTLELWTVS